MANHTVTISVLADTRKFSGAMRDVAKTTGLSRLSSGLKTAAVRAAQMGAALTAAGIAAGAKFVQQAGNLEQSIGAIDTVFKSNSKQVHTWAKSAWKDVGLTQNSYNELATLMGTQLKNGGTALDQLGKKTNDLIGVGADLSSMFGGTTKEAVEALSSALKGERDPIERYGVSLNQARIDAKAAELGFKKVGGTLSNEANQAATLALIMEQTADAHGNFAKESKTLQGLTERLKARFENLTTQLGMKLLPAVAKVIDWISGKLDPALAALTKVYTTKLKPALDQARTWLSDNREEIGAVASEARTLATNVLTKLGSVITAVGKKLSSLAGFLVRNRDTVVAIAKPILAMVAAWKAYQKVMAIVASVKAAVVAFKAMTVAVKASTAATVAGKVAAAAATAVQWLWNAALTANPIGLIITAIAALIAGLVLFFTKTDAGKAIFTGFVDTMKTGWEAVKSFFKAAWKVIQTVFKQIWNAAKTYFSFTPLGLILNNWNKILKFFKSVPTIIKAVFKAAASWLLAPGKSVISGMRTGLVERWTAVKTWFTGRKAIVVAVFSKALSWLTSTGRSVISGMRTGLVERWTAVKTWFTGRKAIVVAVFSKALSWLTSTGRSVISGMRTGLVERWTAVKTWLAGRKAAIVGFIKNPGSILWSAGSAIMSGLWNGLKSKWESVKSWVGGLGSWIAGHKGPKSYDLRLLVPAGGWIMQGLSQGLTRQLPTLRKTLSNVTATVAGTQFEPLTAGTIGRTTTPTGGVSITVNTGVGDPHAIAREIQAVLHRYNRANGGRS